MARPKTLITLSLLLIPQVSLDKARAKSEAVVGQEDVPMRSKMKEVEKIYAKARAAAGQGGKVGMDLWAVIVAVIHRIHIVLSHCCLHSFAASCSASQRPTGASP